MVNESLSDQDYSPQELIDNFENLLAQSSQPLPYYAHIELVNRSPLNKHPGDIHRADEFPLITVTKSLHRGEPVYRIRGEDDPRLTGNRYLDGWREAAYVVRDDKLYKRTCGQERTSDGILAPAIDAEQEERKPYVLVPPEELNQTYLRLLNGRFELRKQYEAHRSNALFQRTQATAKRVLRSFGIQGPGGGSPAPPAARAT